jgi:hypothetical protein
MPSNKPFSDEAVRISSTSSMPSLISFTSDSDSSLEGFLSFYNKISITKLIDNYSPKFIWLFISVPLGIIC